METRCLLSTITVNSLDDTVVDDGRVTLREALIAANEDRSVDGSTPGSGSDIIQFDASIAGGEIQLVGGELEIQTVITVDGPSNRITIDAGGDSRIFNIGEVSRARLQDLELIHGQADVGGAVLSQARSLFIVRSRFNDNVASDDGGAIASIRPENSTALVSRTQFTSNRSPDGAVVSIDAASTTIESSTFTDNTGLSIVPGWIESVTDSTFTDNDARLGHIVVADSISTSEFTGNIANTVAWATDIVDSVFDQNTAGAQVVHVDDLDFDPFAGQSEFADLTRTQFTDNSSPRAVYSSNYCFAYDSEYSDYLVVRAEDVTITGNSATGISGQRCGWFQFSNGTISGNNGDGISAHRVFATGATIQDNLGAGVQARNPDAEFSFPLASVRDSTVSGNLEGGVDSAYYAYVDNSTISGNQGFAISASYSQVENSTIYRNLLDDNRPAVEHAVRVRNSIISGNVARDSQAFDLTFNVLYQANITNSLVGSNHGNSLSPAPVGSPDENGNLVGTRGAAIDPILGSLADNGGTTLTHAVHIGSPVIDMAAVDHEFDQIGRPRDMGTAPDIGAFEFDPNEMFPTDVTLRVTDAFEAAGEMVVTVGLLSLPDAGEEITVTVDARGTTTDDRAIEGSDFTFSPTTLTFTSDSEPLQRVTIPIIDNDIANFDKTLEVFVESTTGPVGDIPNPVVARLLNDERATISFAGVRTAEEDSGAFRLSLELDRAVEIPFRASVQAFGGSAQGNVDFDAIREDFDVTQTGPRTFEFDVPIIDDAQIETNESLFVDLTVSGESLGRLLDVAEETIQLTIEASDTGIGISNQELIVFGSEEGDTILIRESNDTLVATLNDETQSFNLSDVTRIRIDGFGGADSIRVNSPLPAVVNAGDGDDTVFGGSGDDVINGGAGDDAIDGRNGNDSVRGNQGHDLINGRGGSDSLVGDTGRDTILGGDERDTIRGGGGHDSILAQGGDDAVLGNTGADTIRGGNGNDWIDGGRGPDSLHGERGTDSLIGGDHDDFLSGGEDADTLSGDSGADELRGGLGDDWIGDSDGAATAFGGSGNDNINGAPAADGGPGDDFIRGTAGSDSLKGGVGEDIIEGNGGLDTLRGGGDNDEITGSGLLMGEDGRDTLLGGIGPDTLIGGADNDTLKGREGDDSLMGEDGNDLVLGEDGNDTVLGGPGDDRVRGGDDHDSVDGGDGDDEVKGGRQNDTLLGGEGNDTLGGIQSPGETGADMLDGGAGDDMLIASGGNDTANGSEGHDVLFGGSGNDQLIGGPGNDAIFSGSGRDTLSGGEGSDLVNASVFFKREGDEAFRSEFVAAWASAEPYSDRIAAARAVLVRHEERFIPWDESTGDANVFLADPGLDWLHVDIALDDFMADDGERVFELQ